MLYAALRLGIDLQLFMKLKEANGAAMTCEELAKATNSEEALLSTSA
jgi:hypothetical protein